MNDEANRTRKTDRGQAQKGETGFTSGFIKNELII